MIPVSYTHLDVYKRQVLDRRPCRGVVVPANRAREYCPLIPALHVLPGMVTRGIAIALLPAHLLAARDLGCCSRLASSANQTERGTHPGGGRYAADHSHLE